MFRPISSHSVPEQLFCPGRWPSLYDLGEEGLLAPAGLIDLGPASLQLCSKSLPNQRCFSYSGSYLPSKYLLRLSRKIVKTNLVYMYIQVVYDIYSSSMMHGVI